MKSKLSWSIKDFEGYCHHSFVAIILTGLITIISYYIQGHTELYNKVINEWYTEKDVDCELLDKATINSMGDTKYYFTLKTKLGRNAIEVGPELYLSYKPGERFTLKLSKSQFSNEKEGFIVVIGLFLSSILIVLFIVRKLTKKLYSLIKSAQDDDIRWYRNKLYENKVDLSDEKIKLNIQRYTRIMYLPIIVIYISLLYYFIVYLGLVKILV